MRVSHGHSTMGGIDAVVGINKEKSKREKVSHQLGGSMGYGDAHQSISMRGVGIAMQQMH